MALSDNLTEQELQALHHNNIDVKNREIFLHSYIDSEEESGVDYRSAVNFEKNIR